MLKTIRLIALTSTALVGMTAAAQAEPVSAAILGTLGVIGAAGSGALLTAGTFAANLAVSALTLTVSMGLSLASSLLNKPKKPVSGGTSGTLQTGGVTARSFVMGRGVVSHSLAYANTDGGSGKSPNAILSQVFVLSDLPIRGLAELWVNGQKVEWPGGMGSHPNNNPLDRGFVIPGFEEKLQVKIYDGTQTEADANLVSRFGTAAERPWTADHKLLGRAYAVVTAIVDQKLFKGFPQFKFVVDGIALYDPRKDSTVGGSGSHRWGQPATYEWSDNPMVQAYNAMRGVRTPTGQWFYGGQTVSSAQLPLSAWVAAMNECDASIALVAGGTEKQYRSGGEISLGSQPAAAIQAMLATCNGRLADCGGVYKPKVGAPGLAVYSFSDADVLVTEDSEFKPFKTLDATINQIKARYSEPGEGWTAKDAPDLKNAAYETADGGRRQPGELALEMVSSGTQVQRLMASALEEARRERIHSLVFPPGVYPVEPLDFVSWTSPLNGYDNKLFRVDQARYAENYLVGLTLSEVDPADYNWVPGTQERPITRASLKPRTIPAQGFEGFAATGVTIDGADGRTRAAIRLTWNASQVDVNGVQFEVRDVAGTAIVASGETDRWDLGAIIISENVLSATTYQVRGRFRPISVRDTAWSDPITVTTPDARLGQNDLAPGAVDWDALSAELFQRVGDPVMGARSQIDLFWRGVVEADVVRTAQETADVSGRAAARVRDEVAVVANDLGAAAQRVSLVEAKVSSQDLSIIDVRAALTDTQDAVATVAGDAAALRTLVAEANTRAVGADARAVIAQSAATTAQGTANSAVTIGTNAQTAATTADGRAVTAQARADAAFASAATANDSAAAVTLGTNTIFGGSYGSTLIRFGSTNASGSGFSTIELRAKQNVSGADVGAGMVIQTNGTISRIRFDAATVEFGSFTSGVFSPTFTVVSGEGVRLNGAFLQNLSTFRDKIADHQIVPVSVAQRGGAAYAVTAVVGGAGWETVWDWYFPTQAPCNLVFMLIAKLGFAGGTNRMALRLLINDAPFADAFQDSPGGQLPIIASVFVGTATPFTHKLTVQALKGNTNAATVDPSVILFRQYK